MSPRRKSPLSEAIPIFVNREGSIELFEIELLKIPADTASLLVFHGQGGQGKTHLCRELVRRSDWRVNAKFDFIKRAHLDLHDRLKTDSDRALIWIRNAFAAEDLSFPTFDLAFLYYWEQVRREESSPRLVNAMLHNAQDVVGETGTDIGQFLGDLWQDTIDTVPGVKTVYKWISKKAVKAGQEKWLKISRPDTLKAMFDERGQILEAHIIKERLPWFLAQDLNHYLDQNPQSRFVLMIDEYERIALEGGASTAIQENPFDTVFQHFISETNGLLAVFFTRERLRWEEDPDWQDDLRNRQIRLEGLKVSDAEQWLTLEEIEDSEIRSAMINGARETSDPEACIYPLLLKLQIEHYRARIASGQEVSPQCFSIIEPDFKGRCQRLLERVLRDYGEPMQSTLKRLCVAERFDKQAFAHVISKFQTGLPLDRFYRIKNMSFVTEDSEGFILIHRAIRDVMLTWLDDKYKNESVELLLTHYTRRASFDPKTKSPDVELIALNQALRLRMLQDPAGITFWLKSLEEPFLNRAKYSDLEIIWRDVLDFAIAGTERDSVQISASFNNVARTLNLQGRFDEAEPLYKKALEICQCVLIEYHEYTATCYVNLASNLNAQGRYEEAEPLYEKGLEIRERVLGGEHLDTIGSYIGVASNLNAQGRYEEAEPLYKKALEICVWALGEENPLTATSYNNVAYNLNAQGLYEQAEPHFLKALKVSQRLLGENHPATATCYNNVAENYRDQGKYNVAELLYKIALKIREGLLGKDHPDTACSYNNLACNLDAQERHNEGEPLFKTALKIRERTLGEYHPDTACSYNNVAGNLSAQERHEEAEPLFRKSLEIREKVLGVDHPLTADSYNNLGYNLGALGRHDEAEPLLRRSLEIHERVLGVYHPSTAGSYNNIAGNLDAQCRHDEAEPLYKKSLEILERAVGEDHPHTALSYNNIAGNLDAQGRYDEAEPLYRKSLEIRERALGWDHPHTENSYINVAKNLLAQGRRDEAVLFLKKCFCI